MTDEAYRAVFLRVHPTGKMVLSLTTQSDGNEQHYAQLVADRLGVPTLDGLGIDGDGAHTEWEHGYVSSIEPRTRLMRGLFERLH